MNTRPELEALYFAHASGLMPWPKAAVSWAENQLAGEVSSPSLCVLAGLSHRAFDEDVRDALSEALIELGIDPPDEITYRVGVAHATAELIRDGVLNPREGVEYVHSNVISALGHPNAVRGWCALSGPIKTPIRGCHIRGRTSRVSSSRMQPSLRTGTRSRL